MTNKQRDLLITVVEKIKTGSIKLIQCKYYSKEDLNTCCAIGALAYHSPLKSILLKGNGELVSRFNNKIIEDLEELTGLTIEELADIQKVNDNESPEAVVKLLEYYIGKE